MRPATADAPDSTGPPAGAQVTPRRVVPWAALLVGTVLFTGFVYIAVAVATDAWLVAWDAEVTERVVAARTAAWSRLLWLFTLLGNTPVTAVLTVAVAVLLAIWGHWVRAIVVVGAVLSATGVSSLLKALLQRIRPPEVLALIEVPGSHSLPSGHALVMGVFLGLLLMLTWRLSRQTGRVLGGAVIVIAAGLIGFSRIYLGVHWASDVIGGWCVAGVWLLIIVIWFRAWMRRRAAPEVASPWLSLRRRAAIAALAGLVSVAVFVIEALTNPLLA